jgi:hypothetical protein
METARRSSCRSWHAVTSSLSCCRYSLHHSTHISATIHADAVTSHLPEAAYDLAMLLSCQAIQSPDERSTLIGLYIVHLGILSDLVSMDPANQIALPSGYLAA